MCKIVNNYSRNCGVWFDTVVIFCRFEHTGVHQNAAALECRLAAKVNIIHYLWYIIRFALTASAPWSDRREPADAAYRLLRLSCRFWERQELFAHRTLPEAYARLYTALPMFRAKIRKSKAGWENSHSSRTRAAAIPKQKGIFAKPGARTANSNAQPQPLR